MKKHVKIYNGDTIVFEATFDNTEMDAVLRHDVVCFYEDCNIYKLRKAYRLQPGDWVEMEVWYE